MKKWILALALVAPMAGRAEDRVVIGSESAVRGPATRTAQELSQRLGKLALLADMIADGAESNGNVIREERFRDVSEQANCLAAEVRQTVVRALRNGVRLSEVACALDELMPEFADLGEAVQAIVVLPREVGHTMGEIVQRLRLLRSLL